MLVQHKSLKNFIWFDKNQEIILRFYVRAVLEKHLVELSWEKVQIPKWE